MTRGARPIGVDTGGTFTDLITVDRSGRLAVDKRRSTPDAPERAILAGVQALADRGATAPESPVVHGTTVATNTVLERAGAKTALVTTRGFRDVLEIGRGDRERLYDLAASRPEPFVPRRRRIEVDERLVPTMDAAVAMAARRGAPGVGVERRLTRAEVRRVVDAVKRSGANAVAVCLLHAYADGTHERRLGDALAETGIPTSLSHVIAPELREYERTSTTVLNAYVQPRMRAYLEALARGLADRPLGIMQSNGGTAPVDRAAAEPVRTLLSGPAGGVLAALRIAAASDHRDIITFDMGGTSTDVSLARGEPTLTRDGAIAGVPVQSPMIDVHTVGAGGGSIARVDAGGALRVGPESAGATPGPVAYGLGGTDVTITDANVFLGRLDATQPLAGGVALDRPAVDAAIARLARAMGVTKRRAAAGVIDVIVSRMARAVRTISLDRGHDPRDFTLVAFGGAAGLHAADLADALGMETVLLPAHAGVLSAYGLLAAPAIREYTVTVLERDASPKRIAPIIADLEKRAVRTLLDEGHAKTRVQHRAFVDCRYIGQSFDLTVPFGPRYLRDFERAHEVAYGFADRARGVEVVNVRVVATTRVKQPPLPAAETTLPTGTRLRSGTNATFETFAAWVPKGWAGEVDAYGTVVMRRG